MQVRGTFPELSAGMKKRPSRKKAAFGQSMFGAKRAPRRVNAPKTLSGRRAASHAKAYPD